MTLLSQIVYVVDDDEDFLKSISALLASSKMTLQTFSSAQAFLDGYDPSQSGCLVLDVRMPGMSGIELQDMLSARKAFLPIILLSAYGDIPTAVRAVKNGAFDFLEKPFRPQELLDRINQALAHDARQRPEKERDRALQARLQLLSPRERSVLDMLVAGLSAELIAVELHLSVKTVYAHRAKVMVKLGADSLVDLIKVTMNRPTRPANLGLARTG